MGNRQGSERRHARANRVALGILIGLGVSGSGCAATNPDSVASHDGGGGTQDAASLPEEERSITLTLWPFHELKLDEKGFGTPLPLGGVEVCVTRRRPYSKDWKDFTETHGPCAQTEEGKNLVLLGVPGLSELMITATKEGYRPAVFAVTTGPWDQDITNQWAARDNFDFFLVPSDAPWGGVSEVPVQQDRGTLWFHAIGMALAADASTSGLPPGVDIRFLGGARVSLSPPEGDGPFYLLGGVRSPGATRTVPGTRDSVATYAEAVFVNLGEGEYEVKVDHPSASCAVSGNWGNPVHGYARAGGVIRAPVLAGFSTTAISALCFCSGSHDARTCGAPDSGAP